MKLRKKTALIIITVSLALFMLLHIVALTVVRDGFYNVEMKFTERNVTRVITAINEITRNLVTKSSDWAKWDDLYNYVKSPNSHFANSNLGANTIIDLDINIILFLNSNDSIIYQNQYLPEDDNETDIDTNLISALKNIYQLTHHPSIDSISSGLIQFNDKPIIIVSRPILTSIGEGPSNGTLIFGKFIGPEQIEHVSTITNVHFDIIPFASKNLATNMKQIVHELLSEHQIIVKAIDSKTISGYTLVNDILNLPQLIIKITTPREINRQADITLWYLLISFLVIGAIYGVFFLYIMEKAVISRTTALNTDVANIGKSGGYSLRVQCRGNDELTMLSESINTMLETLEKSEALLRNHNNEMQLIMNTIQMGIFSLDENFTINPVCSSSSENILDISPLGGNTIFDALQLQLSSKIYTDLCDFLSLLQIGALPDEEMQELNPCDTFQIQTKGIVKWIHLEFHQMNRSESDQNHILVELKDITTEKLLSEAVAKTEKQNIQLRVIAEDPDLFKEFLHESLQILEQTEHSISTFNENADKSIINEIFRNVHLLKGSCDSFGLVNVAAIAGELENRLGEIRNLEKPTTHDTQGIQDKLLTLSEEIYQTIIDAREIFGEYLLEQPDIMLRLPLERLTNEIERFREKISRLKLTTQSCEKINAYIDNHQRNLHLESVMRGFAKTFRAVPSLIKRLEKKCTFNVNGNDLLIDCILARTLNAPLLHTIRNALDHGVESPEERLLAGKSESGSLTCRFSKCSGMLIIEVSDDGRGIDINKLRDVAIKKGLFSKEKIQSDSDEDILNILFLPGFTTTERVTHVSGRGVGLDAVYTVIKKNLGGIIKVTTKIQSGTTFTFMIPDPSEQ